MSAHWNPLVRRFCRRRTLAQLNIACADDRARWFSCQNAWRLALVDLVGCLAAQFIYKPRQHGVGGVVPVFG